MFKNYEELYGLNYKKHKLVQNTLAFLLPEDLSNILLLSTGSDGRFENFYSNMEVILIYSHDIRDKLEELVKSTFLESHLSFSEYKSFNDEKSLLGFKSNGSFVLSPQRILDSQLLYGQKLTYNLIYQILLDKFKSKKGKKYFKKLKERQQHHFFVTKTGIQNYTFAFQITHYDLDKSLLFYNPEKKQWGVKQGPLRYIQYTLLREFLKTLRSGKNITYISSTIYKIDDLFFRDKLSYLESEDLKESYLFFLNMYFKSQQAYNRGLLEMPFEISSFKEHISDTLKICSKLDKK